MEALRTPDERFADLAGLPDKTTEAAFGADQVARIESRQHPDHDTDG